MITKYTEYIKENNEFSFSKLDFLLNTFENIYMISIGMFNYQYDIIIDFDLSLDDIQFLIKYDINQHEIDKLKNYIYNYISDDLKIDFSKDIEKLFLFLGFKLEQNDNIQNEYTKKFNNNYIHLSNNTKLINILNDLKDCYNIDEYNNIDKFFVKNIEHISESKYLLRLLNFCSKKIQDEYRYLNDAKNFDLI